MILYYSLKLDAYFKNSFLVDLLKNNYGPLSKIYFIYKLNNQFIISLNTHALLLNLRNLNCIDSLLVIKTIKHYENFFDGTKYIILFTSFLFEYYATNFKNSRNFSRINISLIGKLVLKLLSSILIKFSKNIDLKNVFNVQTKFILVWKKYVLHNNPI